jgi:AraC-like DNA-binding protein
MEGVSAITFISIIHFFISILLAVFLLSVKSKNSISNKLFATYLILNAIDYSAYFHNLFLTTPFSGFVILKSLLAYLQPPVLYFYVLSVCYSDFKLKQKHILHIIPFILINIVLYPRFYSLSVPELLKLWEDHNSIWELIFLYVSIHLQAIIYIILIFIVLKKYKKIYYQNFSNAASKTFDWLFQFTLVLAFIHCVALLKNILKYVDRETYSPTMQLIISLLALVVICWYVLKALKHPDLFKPVDSKTFIIYEKRNKDVLQNSKEIMQLISYMEDKKPYLNASLSVRNLAEEIKMNSRDLSILINQNLNQHFFDFINEYRIKEAKNILKNPAKKEVTVLEILYEVGFNSKSSFNTAFKKHTGQTPTEFRRIA